MYFYALWGREQEMQQETERWNEGKQAKENQKKEVERSDQIRSQAVIQSAQDGIWSVDRLETRIGEEDEEHWPSVDEFALHKQVHSN